MRIIRYRMGEATSWGRLEGETIRPLAGPPEQGLEAVGPPLPLEAVQLLAPAVPGKIIAVGRNYQAHAEEFGNPLPEEPLLFSKVTGSIIGPGEPIVIPEWVGQVDYEGELAVVMGRRAKGVKRLDALGYVFGYTCLNDVSARVLQRGDGQYTRGKGLDTFCPLGPWIETDLDPADLALRTELNGKLVQDSRTSLMIFPVDVLIEYISRVMTLYPGDVIATGTPAGVGPLAQGDTIEVDIQGLGRLSNPVTVVPSEQE
jgi:2-keto-4-pentenoate hydratase/2-oxohepta-3-ene-1,7-dioic acid hydratase in catechol pathway